MTGTIGGWVAHDLATKGGVALLIACVSSACVRQLPPAPAPTPIAPPIAAGAPPEGRGRLVVDVVDGPTPIQRVEVASEPVQDGLGRTTYRLFEVPRPMCPASPCVVDVPPSNVLLGFPVIGDAGATEIELVHVGAETSVYRRTLSVYTDNTGALRKLGIIGTSVGGAAFITGVVLLPVGLSKDNDAMTAAGGISMGVGAALVALGIWAIRRDAPTFRPGASNHFSP